ncbi:DUF4291 domain-containing protein [Nocardia beijingensis]|uniref:DUF4291 domain-containing protein n=1 Tax=Nocardia beijingensis TaxID=95162 RepID=UPI0018955391|nr:DUF4291 domain-containing protein [Nocardia beijingensis]MBF6463915.1 DUF4291 domain-containing protein [Nocardia beijingensis]
MRPDEPPRRIRAVYDEHTILVYQAYSPEIAEPALAAGTFVAPFRRERMTWIKPSFLWMMYRCAWASKPGQERVLAITITRSGFEWALAHACLSHYQPKLYPDREVWAERLQTSPVRVQWDPERDLARRPLSYRSLQVGLGGIAVGHYLDRWITGIRDVTGDVRQLRSMVAAGKLDAATRALPEERPYPLPVPVAAAIGASS